MKMVLAVKKNLNLILFVLMMILLIILAYWISERMISHLDRQVPGIGIVNRQSSVVSVVNRES
jgi:flagellar biogenesis protein FliO